VSAVGERRDPPGTPAGRGALPGTGHLDQRARPGVATTASRPHVTGGAGEVDRRQEPVSEAPLPIAETNVAPVSVKPVT
jgi:hypothetical protein